ncbi:Y-family DNA polymerase [Aureimonas ureilytica]|nr:DNA polymerase Y family protein [Aureimonas ureilytica]
MPPATLRPSQREPAPGAEVLRPLALYERQNGAERLVALCDLAARLGLRPGLGVAEARARFPELELCESDRAADRHLLEALADAAERYTPLVALDGRQGLVLDISGCAHLFGGEGGLCREVQLRFRAQGFALGWGLASHPALASALARHRPGTCLLEGAEPPVLTALPIAALRIGAEERGRLARLGLATIGDLLALSRAQLARRFGSGLLTRLDALTGRHRPPIEPRRFVASLTHERLLFEPVSLSDDILRIANHLAGHLKPELEARGQGARRLELTLFRVDGRVERLPVRSARPLRDPRRIERLFAERLKGIGDDLDVGFGYDLLRLSVVETEAMAEAQTSLTQEESAPEALAELLDRLSTRLGETALFSLEPDESHRPERAQHRVQWLSASDAGGSDTPLAPRPLRLLVPPEPVSATAEVPDGPIRQFRWRRAHYRVERIEGPERIAPEWWREDAAPERDYFRVEDEGGRRYWMFREGARPDGASGWFLHGLFA